MLFVSLLSLLWGAYQNLMLRRTCSTCPLLHLMCVQQSSQIPASNVKEEDSELFGKTPRVFTILVGPLVVVVVIPSHPRIRLNLGCARITCPLLHLMCFQQSSQIPASNVYDEASELFGKTPRVFTILVDPLAPWVVGRKCNHRQSVGQLDAPPSIDVATAGWHSAGGMAQTNNHTLFGITPSRY